MIKESPLFWPAKIKGNTLHVLDETLLPFELRYIPVKTVQEAVNVIRQMKTRAFGQFLVVLNTFLLVLKREQARGPVPLLQEIKKTAKALNNSRPTFPFEEVTSIVVGWARGALENKIELPLFLEKNINGFLAGIRAQRLKRVQEIASLIKDGEHVLTHCNVSGELAMAAHVCREEKKSVHFFATETRPYLQGAKLTCWELKKMGADVTLITDSAVGSLMAQGRVDLVIVGSDRSCANGDIANKVGTYPIAVLAQEFGVPFYALTQPSSKVKRGEDIPIEIRNEEELLSFGGRRIVAGALKGFYPAFDVVPHSLITRTLAVSPRG